MFGGGVTAFSKNALFSNGRTAIKEGCDPVCFFNSKFTSEIAPSSALAKLALHERYVFEEIAFAVRTGNINVGLSKHAIDRLLERNVLGITPETTMKALSTKPLYDLKSGGLLYRDPGSRITFVINPLNSDTNPGLIRTIEIMSGNPNPGRYTPNIPSNVQAPAFNF